MVCWSALHLKALLFMSDNRGDVWKSQSVKKNTICEFLKSNRLETIENSIEYFKPHVVCIHDFLFHFFLVHSCISWHISAPCWSVLWCICGYVCNLQWNVIRFFWMKKVIMLSCYLSLVTFCSKFWLPALWGHVYKLKCIHVCFEMMLFLKDGLIFA